MRKLLNIKNLSIYYNTIDGVFKAIDNISFNIKTNEFFGLVGESGCGKSTTALSIMGMLDSTAKIPCGEILLNNMDLVNLNHKKMRSLWGKDLFMIFQDPMTSLNPIMKIGKQLDEVIMQKRGKKISNTDICSIKKLMLDNVEIYDTNRVLNQYPHQISGGMKQRIMITMGTFINPKLLILDEPTTALDATVQFKVIEIIHKLKSQMHMSCLLITHDFGVAAKLCDRIGVMYAGNIVEMGNYLSLLKSPKHPYTKGLFECIIKTGGKVDYLNTLKGFMPSLLELPKGCYFRDRCSEQLPVCKENKPIMVNWGDGHYVACHRIQ